MFFCKDFDIRISFLSFFSCKDTLPKSLHSCVVYQCTCARYKACYIGETKQHWNNGIEKHSGKYKNFIYIHTSKKGHNAKKKLILIGLKL